METRSTNMPHASYCGAALLQVNSAALATFDMSEGTLALKHWHSTQPSQHTPLRPDSASFTVSVFDLGARPHSTQVTPNLF